MTPRKDPLAEFIRTTGGSFHPHQTYDDGGKRLGGDYGCRRCWEPILIDQAGCELGPKWAAIHRDCCPVCKPEA